MAKYLRRSPVILVAKSVTSESDRRLVEPPAGALEARSSKGSKKVVNALSETSTIVVDYTRFED